MTRRQSEMTLLEGTTAAHLVRPARDGDIVPTASGLAVCALMAWFAGRVEHAREGITSAGCIVVIVAILGLLRRRGHLVGAMTRN